MGLDEVPWKGGGQELPVPCTGQQVRVAIQGTAFYFLGLNTVGEMGLAMHQTPGVPSDQRMQHLSRGLREDTFLAYAPKVDSHTLRQAGVLTHKRMLRLFFKMNDADRRVHSFKSAFVI